MKNIPVTQPFLGEEEENAVLDVLRSGWLVQGKNIVEFEMKIAEHENVKHCAATTSCTTALQLAMESSGLKEGMDAIVPAFTFVATANAVIAVGGTPIIVDVRENTYNICVEMIEEKILNQYSLIDGKLINKETGNILWGIVPVHQFGLCADMSRICDISKKYSLKIIEDAACALGSKIDNKSIGTYGNAACVSFHPRKSITTGEGGMVLTNDEELIKKVCILRNHGSEINSSERHKQKGFLLPTYKNAGYNFRMTDIQGAIGKEQIKKLDYILSKRREKAERYDFLIKENIPELIIPFVPEGYYHTYQSYVCLLDIKKLNCKNVAEGGLLRNRLLSKLEEYGIATRQGTHSVPLLEYYSSRFGFKESDFPNAYNCDKLSVSLPLYVKISEEEQKYVVETIRKVIDSLV